MGRRAVRAVGWARSLPLDTDAKTARDWTRDHLRQLSWTAGTPETVHDVLLTVSELVTNAHVHARSSAQLVMTWDERCLHIAVHDDSSEVPVLRSPSAGRSGGRGIFLVDVLADDWAVRTCPTGKVVIACFRPPSRAAR
ncbi:ATP-binding protein [Streptomyces subrutilus]|uniref:ATP-binding protein n=1 Tax=Streptomyces subrutilus TaxID=36818 RepID=A0A1E5Q063_9ACTN|nr:ATP-binding protein [Streptomyces subrutilus]OEJ35195.1 ATP-binding protein [Streptomyces subrutilus]